MVYKKKVPATGEYVKYGGACWAEVPLLPTTTGI